MSHRDKCHSSLEKFAANNPDLEELGRLAHEFDALSFLNQSQGGIYICGAMEIGLGATVKLFRLYLEDGLAPSLDLLHMHIPPRYQFRNRILV